MCISCNVKTVWDCSSLFDRMRVEEKRQVVSGVPGFPEFIRVIRPMTRKARVRGPVLPIHAYRARVCASLNSKANN